MKPEIYKDEGYKLMGAAFEVYNERGYGLGEEIHQECLEIELDFLKIPFKRQAPLPLYYRGQTLRQKFQPDFICYEKIILEIKAVSQLTDEHRAQVLNYLNATGYELGLLVNFGARPRIEYERLVNSRSAKQNSIDQVTLH